MKKKKKVYRVPARIFNELIAIQISTAVIESNFKKYGNKKNLFLQKSLKELNKILILISESQVPKKRN